MRKKKNSTMHNRNCWVKWKEIDIYFKKKSVFKRNCVWNKLFSFEISSFFCLVRIYSWYFAECVPVDRVPSPHFVLKHKQKVEGHNAHCILPLELTSSVRWDKNAEMTSTEIIKTPTRCQEKCHCARFLFDWKEQTARLVGIFIDKLTNGVKIFQKKKKISHPYAHTWCSYWYSVWEFMKYIIMNSMIWNEIKYKCAYVKRCIHAAINCLECETIITFDSYFCGFDILFDFFFFFHLFIFALSIQFPRKNVQPSYRYKSTTP